MRNIKDYTKNIKTQKENEINSELIHILEEYSKKYRKRINDLELNLGFFKDALEEANEAFELVQVERNSLRESLKTERVKTQEEINYYKQLYLDELQKRLELADRVRELEGK